MMPGLKYSSLIRLTSFVLLVGLRGLASQSDPSFHTITIDSHISLASYLDGHIRVYPLAADDKEELKTPLSIATEPRLTNGSPIAAYADDQFFLCDPGRLLCARQGKTPNL